MSLYLFGLSQTTDNKFMTAENRIMHRENGRCKQMDAFLLMRSNERAIPVRRSKKGLDQEKFFSLK